MKRVNIIGAGLAGLSTAITLAEQGFACNLISLQNSERAQSVLAEGGINAALDFMDGGNDLPIEHYKDTMNGGCDVADPDAVRGLTNDAPGIVRGLVVLGVPFHMEHGKIILRNFGGQKNRRTAYAKSSTGKVIVHALVDLVRKYESEGLVRRYPHHEFVRLLVSDDNGKLICDGVRITDTYNGKIYDCHGTVVLATGGLNGLFPGMTTGTVANSGDVTATVFAQGVKLSNLEMLQYHPTTIGISGKRLLVTEAARGEGGRLCVKRDGEWWYFMEEIYPELKNLMPRDVVSREMYNVVRRHDCENQVYLDMTHLSDEIWKTKLPDMRKELIDYLGLDPKTDMIPVEPGIHYFMAGIDVDIYHRTNMDNLYAAGECTSQYHGANRLGGNSMLGAIRGGNIAAKHIMKCTDWVKYIYDERMKEQENVKDISEKKVNEEAAGNIKAADKEVTDNIETACKELDGKMAGGKEIMDKETAGEKRIIPQIDWEENVIEVTENSNYKGKNEIYETYLKAASSAFIKEECQILLDGLGIIRSESRMQEALEKLTQLEAGAGCDREKNRAMLGKAMLLSALFRKESRGAHFREDYPKRDEAYQKMTLAKVQDGNPVIKLKDYKEW